MLLGFVAKMQLSLCVGICHEISLSVPKESDIFQQARKGLRHGSKTMCGVPRGLV